MRVMQKGERLPTRGDEPQRFKFYVVEGERNQNPGRIRTIRVDVTGGGGPWLLLDWKFEQGRHARLAGASIQEDMAELGAFLFTEQTYAEDPNPKRREHGWKMWTDFQKRVDAKQRVKFPAEWLPQKIQDLQALARKKGEAIVWEPPPLDDSAGPTEDTNPGPNKAKSKGGANATAA